MESEIDAKCRLCLGENDDNTEMFELFNNESDKTQIKLVEKIENCCGVRIRESLEMPSKICIKCFDMTRAWYNFRQLVLNSQIYLESMCTDRKIPINLEQDETMYLNYLSEDLTNIKGNLIVPNLQEDELNSDDDFINEDFEEIANIDENLIDIKHELVDYAEDADSEFEKILDDLKTDEIDEHNEIKKKSIDVKKKSLKGNPIKIYRRPPSPPPTSFLCSLCGNSYKNKSLFKYHMDLHYNIKPHKCEICEKAFLRASQLNYHMRRHTGEKPYKCTYCDRRFVMLSKQKRHERIHTNTRPYKCNVCQKTFTYSAALKNHSKTHTGQKDFHCYICNKSFALSHQMKAHIGTILHKQKESQAGTDSVSEMDKDTRK